METKRNGITNLQEHITQFVSNECEYAISLIEEQGDSEPHFVVHELRKSFKKIRAVLQLAREQTEFYTQENHFFRNAGRQISKVRDASSVIEALTLIESHYKRTWDEKKLKEFYSYLLHRRDILTTEILAKNEVFTNLLSGLRSKLSLISSWPINIYNFDALFKAVKRTYQRSKKAYNMVKITKQPDDFHEWRKRVKCQYYQLNLVNALEKNVFHTHENELHELSDALGTDRDLLLLERLAAANKTNSTGKRTYIQLFTSIHTLREELQQKALLQGGKLYHFHETKYEAFLLNTWNGRF